MAGTKKTGRELVRSAAEVAFSGTPEQMDLLKRTYANEGLSQDEFMLFAYQATRSGLDPMARQIYVTKGKSYTKRDGTKVEGKMTVGTTIDGLRLIAERTGKYQGQTEPVWVANDTITSSNNPAKLEYAKVGVYRDGFKEPCYGIAFWDEYAQKGKNSNNGGEYLIGNWAKMPRLMLAKCAEALALRKAFPQELSGLYTNDEMGKDDTNTAGTTPSAPNAPAAEPDAPSAALPAEADKDVPASEPAKEPEAPSTPASSPTSETGTLVVAPEGKTNFTAEEAARYRSADSQLDNVRKVLTDKGFPKVDDQNKIIAFFLNGELKSVSMLEAQKFLKSLQNETAQNLASIVWNNKQSKPADEPIEGEIVTKDEDGNPDVTTPEGDAMAYKAESGDTVITELPEGEVNLDDVPF